MKIFCKFAVIFALSATFLVGCRNPDGNVPNPLESSWHQETALPTAQPHTAPAEETGEPTHPSADRPADSGVDRRAEHRTGSSGPRTKRANHHPYRKF